MIINNKYISNITIISPHYDDAYLSVGGFIGFINKNYPEVKVSIIIAFGRVRCGENDSVDIQGIRIREEIKNALEYNIELTIFDARHSQSRGHKKRSGLEMRRYPVQFIEELDKGPYEELLCYFHEHAKFQDQVFLFPLSIGLHIDHQIARKIGDSLNESRSCSVFYYEDMPYYTFASLGNLTEGLVSCYVMADVESKVDSILTYKSQNSEKWIDSVIASLYTFDADVNKYERLWMY